MRIVLSLACAAAAGNPVEKVLQLLTQLQGKVVHEGEVEQAQYEKFVEWCEENAKQKQYEIKNGVSMVESLTAVIEKATADVQTAESKIADLASAISEAEAELEKNSEVRKREHEEWSAQDSNLAETIDTIERAISTLKHDQAKGFLQAGSGGRELAKTLSTIVDASVLSQHDKAPLEAFMQAQQAAQEDNSLDLNAAVRNRNKEHKESDGMHAIIEIFEDLMDKAEAQRASARKTEKEAAFNFSLIKQSLTDEIKQNNKELKHEKKALAGFKETKSTAEGDLAVTDKTRAVGVEGLRSLQSDCMQKASDHEGSVAERSEEIKALDAAKKVIQEKTGGSASRAYSFSQTSDDSATYKHVVSALRTLARDNGDDMPLSLLASAVSSAAAQSDDPFAKVKQLIESMIGRLQDQAKAEGGHKAYCDKEVAAATFKKEDHDDNIETFDNKIRKADSLIAHLKEDISSLAQEIAATSKSQQEMEQNRVAEHQEYLSAKKDYEDGVEGIQMAIKVLREYYGGSSEFLQQPAVGTHSKSEGGGGGIIAVLEVAESDFSKNLAEVEADERESQEVFERQTNRNKQLIKMKKTDEKYKNRELKETEATLSELKQDRDGEQTELDAVLEYMSKLNKMCTNKPDSYEERKARREQEIEGLKNALQILEGEAMALVQTREHSKA